MVCGEIPQRAAFSLMKQRAAPQLSEFFHNRPHPSWESTWLFRLFE